MQHGILSRKKVCFVLEKKPKQPMSLETETIRAQGIISGNPTVRKEFAIGMVTNGACHVIPLVKDLQDT
jgi:hypothetical protein